MPPFMDVTYGCDQCITLADQTDKHPSAGCCDRSSERATDHVSIYRSMGPESTAPLLGPGSFQVSARMAISVVPVLPTLGYRLASQLE